MQHRPTLSYLAVFVLLAGCSAGSAGGGTGLRRDAGPGTDAGTTSRTDVCGDGMDNNGDGLVDEGCPCAEGAVQPCWPGTAFRRGTGACRDGYQRCERYGEFLAWGACEGAQLPGAEVEGNCIDEDCDMNAPGCLSGCGEFENCGPDGADEDCDGFIDCDDSDCRAATHCSSSCIPNEFGEGCTDGRDNDCDGIPDCADSDCRSHPSCMSTMPPPPPPGCRAEFPFIAEIACGDGRDNDCDGDIDCADSDCRSPGRCGCDSRETACSDGMDNDCDGSTDCSDLECQRCTPGTSRWCDDPVYCHWGRQMCRSDGTFGDCIEVSDRPTGCTGSLYSASCCVSAGGCCQNYPVDDTSIGNCSMIVTCR